MLSPHGIPVDLLDRLVIIRTLQYVLEEIIAILNTRAKVSVWVALSVAVVRCRNRRKCHIADLLYQAESNH